MGEITACRKEIWRIDIPGGPLRGWVHSNVRESPIPEVHGPNTREKRHSEAESQCWPRKNVSVFSCAPLCLAASPRKRARAKNICASERQYRRGVMG